jgi:quinol monooxygenase YgiN
MHVVHVHVHVKADCVEAFKQATIANARESRRELGIAQFDCFQRQDDPTRFILVEAYRDPGAPARHKETPHYQTWRNAVESMLAEPRSSVTLSPVSPDEPAA